MATWTRVTREYPDSIESDSSTFYISVIYLWTNRPDDAKKVLKDFLAKHPRSSLAEGARAQLAKLGALSDENKQPVDQSDNQKGIESSPKDSQSKKAI